MRHVRHGCATMTKAVRRTIRRWLESPGKLVQHHGIDRKIVAEWKKRASVAGLPTGPNEASSSALPIKGQ